MMLFEFLIIAFFSSWLIASILVQFMPSKENYLRKYDPLNLLPKWSFFAPFPATSNLVLLYRTSQSDNQFSVWYETKLPQQRKWYNFIWNPLKRNRKALFDIAAILANSKKKDNNSIMISTPYLLLLEFLTSESLRFHPEASQIQFMITSSYHEHLKKDPRLIFLSNIHRI